MRTPKVILKPWQVIKCQNGHPMFITTGKITDILTLKEVHAASAPFNFFKMHNMIQIGNHDPRWSGTCYCGSRAIDFSFIPFEHSWEVWLRYENPQDHN